MQKAIGGDKRKGIYRVSPAFRISDVNPFTGLPYDASWIMLEVVDTQDYLLFDAKERSLFKVSVSKSCDDWRFRVMDFIGYELDYGKHIILKVEEPDLEEARRCCRGHSYRDPFLREYESSVLVHSTPLKNYEKIMRSQCLKSWNRLKGAGEITEREPIGTQLGDHKEYSDYIMFTNGGVTGEIVVNSKNRGGITMDIDVPYEPGARFYFDAAKIAEQGLLIRDGLHQKVKDRLDFSDALLWVATVRTLGLGEAPVTPGRFAEAADKAFSLLHPQKRII